MTGRASLPLRTLIRENISVVVCYAYSRQPLESLKSEAFLGEWGNLRETVLDFSRHRAERALLELALFLRQLDDQESLGSHVAEHTNFNFGKLTLRDGTTKDLALRDVSNKVIHAIRFQWTQSTEGYPAVACFSAEEEKWVQADINLVFLTAVCGNFSR